MSKNRTESEINIEQEESKMLLQELAPEVFDVEILSEAAEGQVQMADIARAARNEDNSLEKYVVCYKSEEKTFYLSKNTHHEMGRVFQDMEAIHEQMPEGSVPRPVKYLDETESIFYEEVEGADIMSDIENMSENERIQLFKNIGKLMNQFHSMDKKKFDKREKPPSSTIEQIMRTINKSAFENIKERNEVFY